MLARKKRYIFLIGFIPEPILKKYRAFARKYGKANDLNVQIVVFHDKEELSPKLTAQALGYDHVVKIDFDDPADIVEKLLPFDNKILCVVCRLEGAIPDFAKFVPFVPYARVPTSESLIWSTNKISMRRRLNAYNSKLSPRYRIVPNEEKSTIEKIEKRLAYPIVVKPFGLAQSLLVTVVYHREELEATLKRTFKSINRIYSETDKKGEIGVLVEEFMEGEQYSIDAYVNSKGKIYFCPAVHVKTGKQIGFDDFFGYRQMTPTKLSSESEKLAQEATSDTIHALGLRSCTAHVELMKTESGWKIIELGPRVGGFREELYEQSFGFDHSINDLLIRMGKKPVITRSRKGYSAAMKLFSPKEGTITSIRGVKSMEKLDSFVKRIGEPKKVGDRAQFAKNGGKSIVNVFLHNKDRSKLLADVRRIENSFKVAVKKRSN